VIPNKGSGPQFGETVHISEFNGSRKMKSVVVGRLSSSVTFVHPTHRRLKFSTMFLRHLYPSHPLISMQNFTEIVPGKPFRRGVKRKRISQIAMLDMSKAMSGYLGNGARYDLGYV